MPQPLFTMSVAEIERNEVTITWPVPAEWLDAQLSDTEAKSQGKAGELTAFFAKNGREILVQAKLTVDLVMPCARTLDPVPLHLEPDIHLLLSPKAQVQVSSGRSPARVNATQGAADKVGKAAKPGAAPHSKARSARDSDENGELLSDDDAARDTFEGEHVVLDTFVREHIVLELPLFPLRSDLRSEDSPAIRPPEPAQPAERPVDPRLAPLLSIASKLKQKKE